MECGNIQTNEKQSATRLYIPYEGIDWIVIGTETGHRKGKVDSRPEWVLHIADQAQTQGVPVFMKEDLLPIMGEERMIQELPEQFTKRLQ